LYHKKVVSQGGIFQENLLRVPEEATNLNSLTVFVVITSLANTIPTPEAQFDFNGAGCHISLLIVVRRISCYI